MGTTASPSMMSINTSSWYTNGTIVDPPYDIVILTVIDQIVCVLVSIIGIVGNILVLIAFLSKCGSLKTYEMFIASLAVADLFGTLLFPCIQLHEVSGGSFLMLGDVGCKIIHFLSSSTVYVSSLTLVMVCLDRYIAVKWPFKRRDTICRGMIASTWVLGSCCAISLLLGDRIKLVEINEQWICRMYARNTTEDFNAMTAIVMVAFTLQNAIPFLVMTILYSLIIYELYKSTHRTMGCVSDEEMHRRRKDIQKTTKLLIVVVIVFFICVTPLNIFYLLYHFDLHALHADYTYPVFVCLSMLMMANSCVNPLIYGKLLISFRKRMLKLFKTCLHAVNIRVELRASHRFASTKTYKTSFSKGDLEYSQMKTDSCNNVVRRKLGSVDYNFQIKEVVEYGHVIPIGRKVSKETSFTVEKRAFDEDGIHKMLQTIREQMEEEGNTIVEDTICNDDYQYFLGNDNIDRETIL